MAIKTVGEILGQIETMQKHYKKLEEVKETVRKNPEVAKYTAEHLNLYLNDLIDMSGCLLDNIYSLQRKLNSSEVEI